MTEQTMEPLAKHTTFRIGGPADYYLIPESRHEVREAVLYAKEKKLPFYILGKGSNVLFSDEGFRGVVIEVGKECRESRWREPVWCGYRQVPA